MPTALPKPVETMRLDLVFETLGEFLDYDRLTITSGGAFVRSERLPPEEAHAVLMLQLADRGFYLHGSVVRVVTSGERRGYGVEFTGASAAAASDLAALLAGHGEGRRAKSATFNGRLEQLGLAPLIAMLEMERKTGVVEVHNAVDERVGSLFLDGGRIIDAIIAGTRSDPVDESVYEMLGWAHGHFAFDAKDVAREAKISISSTGMLMEAARRHDERLR